RRPWRRKNRRVSRPRSRIPAGKIRRQRLKNLAAALNREGGLERPMCVGAVIPSPWLYQARAPIHPKRPYGLTRPVVPPDGSFLFGARSRESDPVWEFVSKQRTSLDSHNVFHKILLSPCS